jgi:hypothetical protein
LVTVDAGDGAAWNDTASSLPAPAPPAPASTPAPRTPDRTNPAVATAETPAATGAPDGRAAAGGGTPEGLPEGNQEMEQVINRGRTGPSPMDILWDRLFAALPTPPPAGQPAPEVREATANQPTPVGAPPAPALAADAAVSSEHLNTRTPEHSTAEQDLNRPGTGSPAVDQEPRILLAIPCLLPADSTGHPTLDNPQADTRTAVGTPYSVGRRPISGSPDEQVSNRWGTGPSGTEDLARRPPSSEGNVPIVAITAGDDAPDRQSPGPVSSGLPAMQPPEDRYVVRWVGFGLPG